MSAGTSTREEYAADQASRLAKRRATPRGQRQTNRTGPLREPCARVPLGGRERLLWSSESREAWSARLLSRVQE